MNKRVAIMQPYILPYIGYWQMLSAVDTYVIYDDANYRKGGWINRNRMMVNGDRSDYFHVLLNHASPNKKICEITIMDNPDHVAKTMRKIQQNYGKAPFYNCAIEVIQDVFNYKENNLALFLKHSIESIQEYLQIDCEILLSSGLKKDDSLKAEEKVLDICKRLGATSYYNAIGGQDLYNKDAFIREGIELKFLNTRPIEYAQYKQPFISNLSIMDVMMFNDAKTIKSMLQEYDLL